jgi:aspartate carbamoyltransferase
MPKSFFNKSFISIKDTTKEDALEIFNEADAISQSLKKGDVLTTLQGKILGALFYEPSSRTFSSFITAMQRQGGGIIPLNGMGNTSVAKGETIADTARVFSSYADILVVRHPDVGAVAEFAKYATVPVVNAGDGSGEHPTQALLDSYTIRNHFKSFDSLTIGLVGDLLYGRTVHSLSVMLARLGVKKFILISPDVLRMPKEIVDSLKKLGCEVVETESLESSISNLDVIYMTRVQKERFSDLNVYDKYKLAYILSKSLMSKAKQEAVVLHPLPRVGEILEEVDDDKRALYFREEMRNGLYVRMAIIKSILKN